MAHIITNWGKHGNPLKHTEYEGVSLDTQFNILDTDTNTISIMSGYEIKDNIGKLDNVNFKLGEEHQFRYNNSDNIITLFIDLDDVKDLYSDEKKIQEYIKGAKLIYQKFTVASSYSYRKLVLYEFFTYLYKWKLIDRYLNISTDITDKTYNEGLFNLSDLHFDNKNFNMYITMTNNGDLAFRCLYLNNPLVRETVERIPFYGTKNNKKDFIIFSYDGIPLFLERNTLNLYKIPVDVMQIYIGRNNVYIDTENKGIMMYNKEDFRLDYNKVYLIQEMMLQGFNIKDKNFSSNDLFSKIKIKQLLYT